MRRDDILKDLQTMKQAEVARKYDVTPTYISLLIKEEKIKKKLVKYEDYKMFYDLIKNLFERKALKVYKEMLSEEELQTLRDI